MKNKLNCDKIRVPEQKLLQYCKLTALFTRDSKVHENEEILIQLAYKDAKEVTQHILNHKEQFQAFNLKRTRKKIVESER